MQPRDTWAWAWGYLLYVLSLDFYDMLFAGRNDDEVDRHVMLSLCDVCKWVHCYMCDSLTQNQTFTVRFSFNLSYVFDGGVCLYLPRNLTLVVDLNLW